MTKKLKAFRSLILALVLVVIELIIPPASASASSYDDEMNRVEETLSILNSKYAPNIIISMEKELFDDSFASKVRAMSDEELYLYLEEFYKNKIVDVRVVDENSISNSMQLFSTGTWIDYRNISSEAKVSSTIPSIGICWIHIPYVARMKKLSTNNVWYFDRVSVGTSYQTGVSVATWSHLSGTATVAEYNTYVTLLVTGILSYGIPKTPLVYQGQESFTCIVRNGDVIS